MFAFGYARRYSIFICIFSCGNSMMSTSQKAPISVVSCCGLPCLYGASTTRARKLALFKGGKFLVCRSSFSKRSAQWGIPMWCPPARRYASLNHPTTYCRSGTRIGLVCACACVHVRCLYYQVQAFGSLWATAWCHPHFSSKHQPDHKRQDKQRSCCSLAWKTGRGVVPPPLQ